MLSVFVIGELEVGVLEGGMNPHMVETDPGALFG
jgi:hypothetical protein